MSKSSAKKERKGKIKSTTNDKNQKSNLNVNKRSIGSLVRSPKFLIGICFVIVVALAIFILFNFFLIQSKEISIVYPFDKTVFPPEIIAPTFKWKDPNLNVNKWQIVFDFEDNQGPIKVKVNQREWTPKKELWKSIKQRSLENEASVTINSMKKFAGINRSLASQTITISTSKDSVGAPIFYRDVPLPFRKALRNVDQIKWRLGDISSYERPPVVLTDLPVCGNCHSFSKDGKTLGMDVDIGNDKGAYVLTSFEKETILSRDKLISWSDFVRDEKVPTFGMLPRVSPSGRYVVSGVKDRSVFLPRRNVLFSQIFFPVMGILAYYDRQTGEIHALPGADDEEYVQANGTWTPDEKYVVFARNKAANLTAESDQFKDIILNKAESIEVLGGEKYLEEPQQSPKKFMYSLYKVPFNDGKGGKSVPIKGASHNGMSNYFPKFSPDGKWLVFTQAHSFMLLQPDSKLYIMPAEGGKPRLMNCNTNRMNSWHSWSPNSKWLVFSSKMFTSNTQLFLTHIDENGNDTPPVLLRNFTPTDEDRGVNIPEFVNIRHDAKRMIKERFLDDYNYFRSGRIYEQFRQYDRAEEDYLKSLKINPKSTYSLYSLASLYAKQEDYKKAKKEFEKLLEIDPNSAIVHKDLGSLYFATKKYHQAMKEFKKAIQLDPDYVDAHYNLGSVYNELKRFDLAEKEFKKVLQLETEQEKVIGAHFNLGSIYLNQKAYQRALDEFETILKLDPENTDAYHNIGNIYAILNNKEKAKKQYDSIIRIDPQNISAHTELGQLYAETKEYENAIKEFRKVLELDPDNLFAKIYLGRIYTATERYDEAADEYFAILEKDPDNIYAHINLGRMYTKMEDYDNAILRFKEVLKLNPNDYNACFMLAELYSDQKEDTKTAISYLKKGLSIKPKYFDGRIMLGNAYLKIGDIRPALKQFEIAYRINPNALDLREKITDLKKRLQKEEKKKSSG